MADAAAETWKGIDQALRGGYRGLPGGTTLARLLAQQRGVRNRVNLPRLTERQIAHLGRGALPTHPHLAQPPIRRYAGTPDESWAAVDLALRWGYRGLPGGSSLVELLRQRDGPSAAGHGKSSNDR